MPPALPMRRRSDREVLANHLSDQAYVVVPVVSATAFEKIPGVRVLSDGRQLLTPRRPRTARSRPTGSATRAATSRWRSLRPTGSPPTCERSPPRPRGRCAHCDVSPLQCLRSAVGLIRTPIDHLLHELRRRFLVLVDDRPFPSRSWSATAEALASGIYGMSVRVTPGINETAVSVELRGAWGHSRE
jgi:hypothetical protein